LRTPLLRPGCLALGLAGCPERLDLPGSLSGPRPLGQTTGRPQLASRWTVRRGLVRRLVQSFCGSQTTGPGRRTDAGPAQRLLRGQLSTDRELERGWLNPRCGSRFNSPGWTIDRGPPRVIGRQQYGYRRVVQVTRGEGLDRVVPVVVDHLSDVGRKLSRCRWW